ELAARGNAAVTSPPATGSDERRYWKADGTATLVNFAIGKWHEALGEDLGWSKLEEESRNEDSITLVGKAGDAEGARLLLKDNECVWKKGEGNWVRRYSGSWKRERDVPSEAKNPAGGVFLSDLVALEVNCLGLTAAGFGGNEPTLFASNGTVFSKSFRVKGQ